MLSHCELCPHRCGANRLAGERGYCRAGSRTEVYRWAPHHGEEPPISGTRGSGTIFFGRCTLRCLYCQNYPWSQGGQAAPREPAELAGILKSLHADGCHNWNLVSPTPWLPMIHEALTAVRQGGLSLPVVYNSSGFERVETLTAFATDVDVYLVDLRYARSETAAGASGAGDYVEKARGAIREMWRQTGPMQVDEDGVAQRGTICRVLILPGHADEAVAGLQWLAESIGTEIPVSVMAQYTPAYRALRHAEWARRISVEEYDAVRKAVDALGFENGWIQDMDRATPANLIGYQMQAGGA